MENPNQNTDAMLEQRARVWVKEWASKYELRTKAEAHQHAGLARSICDGNPYILQAIDIFKAEVIPTLPDTLGEYYRKVMRIIGVPLYRNQSPTY